MFRIFPEGLSPVLPVIFLVAAGVFCLLAAWWSYSPVSSIAAWKKRALILLRAGSFFILFCLLFNPFFSRQDSSSQIPRIAVYLDNSKSIAVDRGDYNGLDSYQALKDEFEATLSDRFEYVFYRFGDTIEEREQIDAGANHTRLEAVMEHILEHETGYRASVIFSDGIVTGGRNPVYTAQSISSPVFTAPVGDTVRVRDIALGQADYNQPVFTNSLQTIRVDVQQEGYSGEEVSVELLRDGELVETQGLSFEAASTSHQAEFTQEFEEEGFFNYEIRIPEQPEEFSSENNSRSFTIEVLDDKTRILSLAFEIHPDVGAIRRLIATDQQNELISSISLGGSRFIGEDPGQLDPTDLDLIVLHGLPPADSPLSDWIESSDLPVVYAATPGSFSLLQSEEARTLTGIGLQQPQQVLGVHIRAYDSDPSHPLLELESSPFPFPRFPVLTTFRGTYNLSSMAEPLLYAEFQRTETDIPLLVAEDTSPARKTAVNAVGWHHYERSVQEEAQLFFRELFTNILSWTATSPDRRTLVLEPEKEIFSENEPVAVRAVLYNERGEPETDGDIELLFFDSDDTTDPRAFRMNNEGNGNYSLDLGSYPRGIYRVEGSASKDGRILGTAETRVHVSESSLELVNTRRNDPLLRQLADITGGLFLGSGQFEEINSFMADHNLDEISEETSTNLIYLYQTAFWFLVVMVLLTAEWILRRSVSLP